MSNGVRNILTLILDFRILTQHGTVQIKRISLIFICHCVSTRLAVAMPSASMREPGMESSGLLMPLPLYETSRQQIPFTGDKSVTRILS